PLAQAVPVLVHRERVDAIARCDVLVVGDPGEGVAEPVVRLDNLVGRLPPVGETAPRAAVRMEVGPRPVTARARIRVQECGACELDGRREPIDGTARIWHSDERGDHHERALEDHARDVSMGTADTPSTSSRSAPPKLPSTWRLTPLRSAPSCTLEWQ